ncbi:MAG TPA: hypothetical protein QGG47_12115 [Acidobacteriota bacterium]|nr:hypothetical protein [Acidobacteriota bacterium]
MQASLLSLLMIAAVAIPNAAPARSGQEREYKRTFSAANLDELYIDFPIGKLEIEGTSTDQIEVEVSVECEGWRARSCRERADRVELEPSHDGDRLELAFTGFSKWRNGGMHINMKIRLPAPLDLAVDMSIGEVSLRMREADVGRLSMDTGIGESSLVTPAGRSASAGLFTRELRWEEGHGEARIHIDLGIGEVAVRLS